MNHIQLSKDYWNDRTRKDFREAILVSNKEPDKFEKEGDRHFELFKNLIKPNMVVLDYGTGCGRIAKRISTKAKRVIGIDMAEEMESKANEYMAGISNFDFCVSDGKEIDEICDESIDMVFSILCHQHIPKTYSQNIVNEWNRVLKKDGILWFQTVTNFYNETIEPGDNNVWVSRRYTEDEIRKSVSDAGFKNIEISIEEGGAWWIIKATK